MRHKRIVLVASNATAFHIFCGMVKSLKMTLPKELTYTFFVPDTVNTEMILARNSLDYNEVEIIHSEEKFHSEYKPFWRFFYYPRIVGHLSIGKYLKYKQQLVVVKEMKSKMQEWLKINPPCLILLYGDRMLWSETMVAALAKELNIPSVYCSIMSGGGYTLYEKARIEKGLEVGKMFPIFDNYVAKKNMGFFISKKNRKSCFYDVSYALAGYKANCISLNPWVNGGGDAQIIAAVDETQKMELKNHLSKTEFESKMIYVTGDIEEKSVIQSYQQRLKIIDYMKKRYSISDSNILTIAVPRYAGYDRWSFPYEKYMKNVYELIRIVSKTNFDNILLSIHPKDNPDSYRWLENEFSCKVIYEPLKNFIGISDIYIYEKNSTTRRWADLLHIPKYEIQNDFSGKEYDSAEFFPLEDFLNQVKGNSNDSKQIALADTKGMDIYSLIENIICER